MAEPVWITYEESLQIQREQIDLYGGSHGLRDEGMLQSALGRPQNLYHYSDPKPALIALAASYAYGIAKNHPFVDGNKRTAFLVCVSFLRLNDIEFKANGKNVEKAMNDLAMDHISEQDFAVWLARHV